MFKKITAILMSLALSLSVFTACGASESSENTSSENTSSENSTLSIITTIFPEYDWVREIVGDVDVNITWLISNGVDLHSFQPSVDDIVTISSCDMFIYVGGESDEWVEDALEDAVNDDMVVISLLEVLGDAVKEEEVIEGMQAEEEEEEDEDEDEEEVEYDEHVWLSIKNAEVICDEITAKLCEIDSSNADTYKANNQSYQEKLVALDERYSTLCDSATEKTLLFADRFPFRYLVDDYDLSYYAAFVGCSAETEASFETIVFLTEKVTELGLKYIFTLESSDQKIAQTIIESTTDKTAEILVLNSMQSVTSDDAKSGVTYISLTEENLAVLEKALG